MKFTLKDAILILIIVCAFVFTPLFFMVFIEKTDIINEQEKYNNSPYNMNISCYTPNNNELKLAWTFSEKTNKEHCLDMSKFATGGKVGVVTIKCEEVK
jgi:hypothetical protein